jgi:hypothetical protein
MRTLRLAVAAILLAVLPAGPAAAADAAAKRWTLAKCLQAGLSTVSYEPDVEYFTVAGTATQCQAPDSTTYPTGFGVALFDQPNGFGNVMDWNIRTFPAAGDPWHPTEVAFGAAAVPGWRSGQFGVCVVYQPPRPPGTPIWVRVHARPAACVLVTVTRPEQGAPAATAVPLPTDAPMLSRGALVPGTYTGATAPYDQGSDDGGNGNCGTCF